MSYRHVHRQAGVGLVTAIFLLVVIAGLAAALVNIFTSQQASSQLDQQGTRAYQAARAGIEWAIFRQAPNRAGCVPTGSFALPSTSMLGAFTVTVTCTMSFGPSNTNDPALNRFLLRAIACNQPDNGACPNSRTSNNLDYVQRVVEVQL